MSNENRLKQENGEVDPDMEQEQPLEETTKKEAEPDESQEPALEDCFEYKLVGVTVHSGSAHAGHYWSYINTCRG